MNLVWLQMTATDAAIEREQLVDEGRDVSPLSGEFEAVQQPGIDAAAMHNRVMDLLDSGRALPFVEPRRYVEPNDLTQIRLVCPQQAQPSWDTAGIDVEGAMLGAWLGRVGGCLLGKPVEGFRLLHLHALLEDQDNWPLCRYITRPSAELVARAELPPSTGRAYIDAIESVPEDDDVNYTLIGLTVLQEHGPAFTAEGVAATWLARLPVLSTCTAERAAYRNLMLGLMPPASALHGNPYREWIGAQIRADAYGYVALGDPRLAAEWAWRDATVSHMGNGIYGEMWVAAMIAAAPFLDGPRGIILRGLREVPRTSRLAEAVHAVLGWHAEGITYEEAVRRVHARWHEDRPHHWCHVISNAQVVALALLWGEDDPAQSICRAVQPGFDTDCNGATVGSIMGMRHGARSMPEWLVRPLAKGVESGVRGYHRFAIPDLAMQTVHLLRRRKDA
jgi:hypothetical protein